MKRTSLRSSRLLFALSAVSLLLAVVPLCSAGIAEDIHAAVVQNRLDWAESALKTYVAQHGQTPEYLDALSWLARGYLNGNQPDRAQDYAKQIEVQARQQLLKRQLDTEPHLPNALGAAIEVEAQVLVSRGQRAQAIAVLHSNLARYRATSIRARLQKNLNLLSLTGQPAPPLNIAQYLGPKPNDLSALKGSPVLLFFWARTGALTANPKAQSSPSSAPSSGPRALPSSRRLSFMVTPPKESQPIRNPSLRGLIVYGSTFILVFRASLYP
jgi:hypothetical protein